MKRKIIALLLCIVCVFSLCFPAAADDDGYSAIIGDIDKTCPTCGSALHAFWWSTSGAEVEVEISDTGKIKIPAGAGAIAHIDLKCKSCGYEKKETRLLGLDFGAEKPGKLVQAPSGIGRKDLPGYADDDGTPSVSSDGGIIWQPTWDDVLDCNFNLNFDSRYYGGGTEYNLQKMKNGSYNTSTSNSSKSFVFSETQLTVSWNYTDFSYASNGVFSESSSVKGTFKFKTPIRGYYSRLKTPRLYFKAGNETLYYPADTKNTLYDGDSILSYPGMLGAGYFTNEVSSSHHVWQFYMPQYKIIPFDSADKPTSFTNITINNNTWNGNIYTDNSTNLTYIYPQYTTVNEKNETVTNISNTPIIYNNETKQYYTYDQTTKNYYYINYGVAPTPTPAPTETPTPSPDPTEEPSPSPTPAPTDKPGGSISTPETGKPGGSSGSSWWDKLLSKIGDAIIDGLLGAVSAVLKLIFKLFSTILSWIIWAVSRVFDLLPFLPPGLGGLLVGGVVVCFVIGIIKFIRG